MSHMKDLQDELRNQGYEVLESTIKGIQNKLGGSEPTRCTDQSG